MAQHPTVGYCFRCIGVELSQQDLSRIETHEHSTAEQEPAHPQGADALYLSISVGEAFARWFEGPRDRTQSQEIRDQIGERVIGVGDQGL